MFVIYIYLEITSVTLALFKCFVDSKELCFES